MAVHAEVKEGYCGDNLKWRVDTETGVLRITSDGKMDDQRPWYDYRESIKTIELPEGLENLSNYAFSGFAHVKELTIPSTVMEVGYYLFDGGGMEDVEFTGAKEIAFPDCSFTAPEGKHFGGWQKDDQLYQPGEEFTLTENQTLTAVWIDSVIVTLFPNGGEGEKTDIESGASDYTLPECTFTPPANKTFAGWFIDGEIRQPGEVITLTGDLALYAMWDAALCTVTVDPDGAEGTVADFVILSGTAFVFPACTLTAPEGTYFNGWQIGDKTYQPGDSVEVIESRDVAVGFYKKLGYTVTDGAVIRGETFDCIRMEKQLPEQMQE